MSATLEDGHSTLRSLGLLLAAALFAVLLTPTSVLAAPSLRPARLEPARCPGDLPEDVVDDQGITCGFVEVPLRHGQPASGSIALAVAVLRAADETPAADPLIVLAGGPGEQMLPFLPSLVEEGTTFRRLAQDRDVVLLDQRGVGHSRPALECPEIRGPAMPGGSPGLQQEPADRGFLDRVEACAARLIAEGHDLAAYTTQASAEDLDLVRRALGYERVNLYGTSYGARLAIQAARVRPETLRSLVLSSPIPAQANYVQDAQQSLHSALSEVIAACEADSTCARTLPDLSTRLDQITRRLAAHPAEVEVTDPETGTVNIVRFGPADLARSLSMVFYAGRTIPRIPALIALAEAGEYEVLLATSAGEAERFAVSQGMQYTFQCAEEVSHADRSVAEQAAGLPPLVMAASGVGALAAVCARWPVEPADASVFAPVQTDVPALVVTGRFDHVTPPHYGEMLAAGLDHATLVRAQAVGHAPLENLGDCGVQMIATFLQDPRSELDARCAAMPIAFPLENPEGTPTGQGGDGGQATDAPAGKAGGGVGTLVFRATAVIMVPLAGFFLRRARHRRTGRRLLCPGEPGEDERR